MEKVYSLTSTKQVKNLEAELKKEIKELRERIEDAESLYSSGTKSFRYGLDTNFKFLHSLLTA